MTKGRGERNKLDGRVGRVTNGIRQGVEMRGYDFRQGTDRMLAGCQVTS